jgi:peptidoglycan/xylan/chitin deacetylase (PgdA/CDA1 family)
VKVGPKTALDAAIRWSPAQLAFQWRAARRLAVLAYHGVDDAERFEEHLNHIRRRARAVSLEQAIDAFEGRRQLPERAVLITFDDGHRSVLEIGMPLLRDRGLPAAVFVIADLLDTERPFWWVEVLDLMNKGGVVASVPSGSPEARLKVLKRLPNDRRRAATEELRRTASAPAAPMRQLTRDDLRTLESAGVAVGSHTCSHPYLSKCTDADVLEEIEDSHRVLTGALGHEPASFAYPYGDHDPRAEAFLRERGYRAAFLFDHRVSEPRPHDPLRVSRLRVNSYTPTNRFRTIASGLHPAIHRVRGGA